MSSYKKRSQGKPTTAAGLRAQASANGSSIFGNRSRSISGLFPMNQNSYSGLLGVNGTNHVGLPKFLNKTSKGNESFRKSPYSSSTNNLNYQNLYTTYGGTSSGYGSITLPSINSLRLTPSTSYGYLNLNPSSHSQAQRTDSFNKTKTKPDIHFGSRSSSLQSLASSEGYIVRQQMLNFIRNSALY